MKEVVKEITIPDELAHPFFFPQHAKLMIDRELLFKFDVIRPFFYEAVFYSNIEGIKPWKEPEKYVSYILKDWQAKKHFLHDLFTKKDRKGAEEPMKTGTALFLELLFWTNEFPVNLFNLSQMDKLKFHPMNFKERLAFIINRPSLYHSYIQLTELMTEMEKQYSKKIALKSRIYK